MVAAGKTLKKFSRFCLSSKIINLNVGYDECRYLKAISVKLICIILSGVFFFFFILHVTGGKFIFFPKFFFSIDHPRVGLWMDD